MHCSDRLISVALAKDWMFWEACWPEKGVGRVVRRPARRGGDGRRAGRRRAGVGEIETEAGEPEAREPTRQREKGSSANTTSSGSSLTRRHFNASWDQFTNPTTHVGPTTNALTESGHEFEPSRFLIPRFPNGPAQAWLCSTWQQTPSHLDHPTTHTRTLTCARESTPVWTAKPCLAQ